MSGSSVVAALLILLSAYLLYQVVFDDVPMLLGWIVVILVVPVAFAFGNAAMMAVGLFLTYFLAAVPGLIGLGMLFLPSK